MFFSFLMIFYQISRVNNTDKSQLAPLAIRMLDMTSQAERAELLEEINYEN